MCVPTFTGFSIEVIFVEFFLCGFLTQKLSRKEMYLNFQTELPLLHTNSARFFQVFLYELTHVCMQSE